MIRQLDKNLINKIAAGEVVERPLSIVKELTENAIDAGAGTITVEIKNGGLSLIRVTDNGSGIPGDEVMLAFTQHATSKISDIEDLSNIGTLGFRGEALASIASVSQIEMITKITGALSGTRIELHGGVLAARQELGCSEGTTVNVSNLFFNTPARLKFLKKPATETGYITDLIQRLALGYPRLAFRYITNGQIMIATNGNGDLKTSIYQIYGKDVARGVVPVETDDDFLSGYTGKPEVARGSRAASNFFINGRYIKSELLQSAVEEAYRSRLTVGKFPLCVLHLKVPPDQVDVNVHPAKMEVRFAKEQEVYSRVGESLGKALSICDLVPGVRPSEGRNRGARPGAVERNAKIYNLNKSSPNPVTSKASSLEPITPKPVTPKAFSLEPISPEPVTPKASSIEPISPEPVTHKAFSLELINPEPLIPKAADTVLGLAEQTNTEQGTFPSFTIIGQIFGTYWLAVQEDQLFLIDQHAAHERILYEEMLHRLKNGKIPSQPLLEPHALSLSPNELAAAQEHKQALESFGFKFEVDKASKAGDLLAVPAILKGSKEAFFMELLGKLEIGSKDMSTTQIQEELAMAACKAAVKANDHLTVAEARGLINRMLALENPYNCPHGRPTMVKLTQREIELMFKRT